MIYRVFISVFILFLNIQSWTKADSIKDLDIEGIEIGKKLTNYFNKDEILKNSHFDLYGSGNNKFVSFFTHEPVNLKSYEQYDYLRVTYLNNGSFLIHSVTGMKDYAKSDMDECYKLQKSIESEFDNQFSNLVKEKDTFPSRYDETGESKVTGDYYYTDDGYAEISCYDFAKHIKIISGIDVSISTEELGDWLGNLRKN